MDSIIKCDLFRYGGLVGFKGFLKGLFIPGFRYTYLLRHAAKHKNNRVSRLFFRIIIRKYSFKYGFQIDYLTKIGKGFYIGHHGSVIINSKAIIGDNCNVAPGVFIGQANRGWIKGYPTIGDRVWIGANSVIVGKIVIGSNVLIAPNTTVDFNVPDNSMVRGNPGKTVQTNDATEGYLSFILK